MKKYILSSLAVLSAATLFTSCDDMLDTDPRVTEATTLSFPGYPADVEALNAATYSIMNVMGGGDSDSTNPFYWWEIMSDNCYGSGGLQDNKVKAMHHLVEMSTNQYEQVFILLYGGIKRANNQIETIDNVDWTGKEAQRNQLLGEGYFMRGLYTLWLTQLFGDVPLLTLSNPTPEMEKQVSAEEVIYPQILADFVSAKNLMTTNRAYGSGHADKYTAESFIARAYMFWAGFYKNVGELATGSAPAINLLDRNGEAIQQEGCNVASVSQADVISGLKDIVSNGGYKLCEDYRSLWQYSNSLLWDEAHDNGLPAEYFDADGNKRGDNHAYAFIADMKRENCFDQPGMGNGNTEEIFQIQFMNASSWSIGDGTYTRSRMYSNYVSCFWGLRNGATNNNGKRETTYPFNQGWGQGTPSVNIWQDWTAAETAGGYTDIRKLGSMIDLDNEIPGYTYEKDDCEESGYAVKKFNGVILDACDKDLETWWTKAPGYVKSSLGNSQQGDHFEDFYLMRYADVLLMLTELTGDAQYMNQVQKRAGVPQTPYSLKAVQDERRWEFAFEGLRFNDMRRWTGNKPTANSYAPKALQAQAGKSITVKGKRNAMSMKHMTCSWTDRYIATNGFLAKPQAQITLMTDGEVQNLEQNPGWDASDPTTQYVTIYN